MRCRNRPLALETATRRRPRSRSLASEAGNPDDAGRGRIIPTTSVDSYAATLARWYGLSESDIDLVLPNLAEFNRDLGFMA